MPEDKGRFTSTTVVDAYGNCAHVLDTTTSVASADVFKVRNGGVDMLLLDAAGNLTVAGTLAASGSPGYLPLSGGTMEGTLAFSTYPFTITATSAISNLNADMLDGYHASSFLTSISSGDLTEVTSNVLNITGGASAVLGTGTTIEVTQASSATDGYLSAADWSTFNSKAASGDLGDYVLKAGDTMAGTLAFDAYPFTISATSVIANLNASYLEGHQWAEVASFPDQSGHAGEFLTTDGSSVSWSAVATGVSTHNDLSGLQGGTTDEYYHLTAAATADLHVAVTLGASANGLTLDTQELNLTPASSGVTGALTGDDWVAFDGKQDALGYTPVNRAGDTMAGTLAFSTYPFTISSTSSISNLNADMLDGYHSSSFIVGTAPAASGGTGQTSYTKGDILAASASDTLSKLSVSGTDGHVLTEDNSTATGLKWASLFILPPVYLDSSKDLVDAVATAFVDIAVPASALFGYDVNYVIKATDGTDYQLQKGFFYGTAYNKTGTAVGNGTLVGTQTTSYSAGSLSTTFSVAGATNKITWSCNCNTSFSSTTLFRLYYQVRAYEAISCTAL